MDLHGVEASVGTPYGAGRRRTGPFEMAGNSPWRSACIRTTVTQCAITTCGGAWADIVAPSGSRYDLTLAAG
jgi:hypothetical protein